MPNPRKPTKILSLTGRLKHDKKRFADREYEPVNNRPLGPPPARLNAALKETWLELQGVLVEGVALVSDAPAFDSMVRLVFRERGAGTLNGPDGARLDRLFARF